MATIGETVAKSSIGEVPKLQREAPKLFSVLETEEGKRQARIESEGKKQAKIKNDFEKFVEYDIPEFWEPMNQAVKKKYEDYETYVADARKQGKYNDPAVASEIQRKKNEVEFSAKFSQTQKDEAKIFTSSIKDMAGIRKDKAYDEWVKQNVYNPDGSLKKIEDVKDVDPDLILENENLYDYNQVNDAFIKNVGEITQVGFESAGVYDQKNVSKASKLVQFDKDGNIDIDSSGNPILNITPSLLAQAKTIPAYRAKIPKMVEAKRKEGFDGYTEVDALEEILAPNLGYEEQKSRQTNQGRLERLRARWKANDKQKFADGFLKPYAALMQGENFKGNVAMTSPEGDMRNYQVADVPYTNIIGQDEDGKETIKNFYKDMESGDIFYESSRNEGELLPIGDGMNLLTRLVNNSKGIFKTDQIETINNRLSNVYTPGQDITWKRITGTLTPEQQQFTEFEMAKPRLESLASSDEFLTEINQGSPEQAVDKLNTEIPSEASYLHTDGKNYTNITLAPDDDTWTTKEINMYGTDEKGNKVLLKKDIDHNKEEEVQTLLNNLAGLEQGKASKEKLEW